MQQIYIYPNEKVAGGGKIIKKLLSGSKKLIAPSNVTVKLRNLKTNVGSAKRMISYGGTAKRQGLGVAKKTYQDLAAMNERLLRQNPKTRIGRLKRRKQMSRIQKLMGNIEAAKKTEMPGVTSKVIKKKPRLTKKQLVGGGALIGAGALGGSYLGSKGNEVRAKYNQYYQ